MAVNWIAILQEVLIDLILKLLPLLPEANELTHWGLVTPYGIGGLGSGNGVLPEGNQAITWTNLDLSSVRSCGIHLRTLL